MANFGDLVNKFIELIMLLVPLVFGLTLLVLIWGIINAWIINGGDEGKIAEGRQIAFAAVIALVVMTGVWGILRILQASLFG